MLYYTHNMHFQALSDAMAGRYAGSRKAADAFIAHAEPALKDMPMVEGFLQVKTYALAHFGKWDEVMNLPEPDQRLHLHHGMWTWARGMALSAKGDLASARIEYENLRAARAKVPILEVAEYMLAARIASLSKDYRLAKQHS